MRWSKGWFDMEDQITVIGRLSPTQDQHTEAHSSQRRRVVPPRIDPPTFVAPYTVKLKARFEIITDLR